MFKNPRRGRQARNFTKNVPKILDLKSSSEQIFSENWRWVPLNIAGVGPCMEATSIPMHEQKTAKYSLSFFFLAKLNYKSFQKLFHGLDKNVIISRTIFDSSKFSSLLKTRILQSTGNGVSQTAFTCQLVAFLISFGHFIFRDVFIFRILILFFIFLVLSIFLFCIFILKFFIFSIFISVF